jgi:GDPmannose 4,6-dehydratase
MQKKVALITGISGQDGSYLAEYLLTKGYLVRGIIRRSSSPNTRRFEHLVRKYEHDQGPHSPFVVKYADLTDPNSLHQFLNECRPDEIYNLGAQSHVGISFNNAISTIQINTLGTLSILEWVKTSKKDCKVYQASSSEMFGISPPPQHELTPMLPQSPYGVSKLAAYHLARLYRNAYGLFIANGILFNHESPRRGLNFVTRKITNELGRIIVGETDKIVLGNLDAKRDWGFSGEYIQAMWLILQHDKPDDFVIATQETHTVREFLEECFSIVGLDYRDFLETDEKFLRPAEVPALLGDASKAKNVLGWETRVKFHELARMMVEADLKRWLEKTGHAPIVRGVERDGEYYLQLARELAQELPKNSRKKKE